MFAAFFGRPGWLWGLEVVLVNAICWCLVQASRVLRRDAPMTARRLPLFLVATGLPGAGLAAWGQPFNVVVLPSMLAYSWLHVWLGWSILRTHQAAGSRFLGLPVVISGLWFFSYPVLAHTPWAWVGYSVSMVLNLMVGVGMLVFLIETTNAQLRLHNEELARLDAAKYQFITTIGHELRTPLTSVITALHILRSGQGQALAEPTAGLLQVAEEQSLVLKRLVNDVFELARLRTHGLSCEKGPTQLNDLVHQVTNAQRPAFDAAGITLVTDMPSEGVSIEADADRLNQVLQNLLDNARKATPAGGRVEVQLARMPRAAELRVVDTGVGIEPEHLARVFEPFFQACPGQSGSRGLGLGLTLSRAIIEGGHQGTLTVTSTPGEGSNFVVTLPVSARPAEPVVFTASRA
ncbi:MAG: HAMP domain-containing sensor histidine kinase [Candidatus Sericytochromatia bacterium]|nr:HAMP domain-containing sensor histidine kinase [Candidatus Sericytochromatia bacterium]MEB3221344.1 HAMP domain-containing sensor histidine kinase [Candidatus Sericytochromatia bacterium]